MHLGHHAWKRLLFITILHCCCLFASENNLNENRLLSFRGSRERHLKVLIIVCIPTYILIIIVTWMIDMLYKTKCEPWKIRRESHKINHWTITLYHKVIFVSLNKHNHDNNRFFESIKLMYVQLRPCISTYKKLKLR